MPNYRNTITGTIAANGANVALAWREPFNGGAGVQVTGTWSGTLQYELTLDGTNWVAVQATNVTTGAVATTTTANAVVFFNVVGGLAVRVASTAWTSGDATITLVGLPG